MDALSALAESFGNDPVMTLAVLGAAGGGLLLFVVFGIARDRRDVRRRAADGVQPAASAAGPAGTPARPSFERLVALLDRTSRPTRSRTGSCACSWSRPDSSTSARSRSISGRGSQARSRLA